MLILQESSMVPTFRNSHEKNALYSVKVSGSLIIEIEMSTHYYNYHILLLSLTYTGKISRLCLLFKIVYNLVD